MKATTFPGRLAVQQRVLPDYRVPFFESLARSCNAGLSLFAGLPRPIEGIQAVTALRASNFRLANNLHILGGSLYLCHQRGLLGWLQEWDPAALILEANPRYLSTPAAVEWMHRRGRRVVGWGLGAAPLAGPLASLRVSSRLRFLLRFDALIAYSQRGAAEYAALGFPRERVFVAHNAVVPAPGSAASHRPSQAEQPTILFVGRLQPRKRLDLLLCACAQLPNPPRLVIVGDGPERDRLASLALQVFPTAEFTGSKHGAELDPYFAAADLFVLPGTGGLAIQQAMSHALPVIVAKGDGTQDDLVRDRNGWQVPPDDLEALVAALTGAVSDVPRLRRMGAESYRIVAEEINLETMVAVFVEALNSL